MHYNLYFNGCSWTKGYGLDELGLSEEDFRFSGVIAKKANKTVCNQGRSGASNDSICRRTIRWFEEGNTCDHAIIQWTFKSRVEWIDEDNNQRQFLPPKEAPAMNRMNPVAREALYAYYGQFYTDPYGFANLYKNMSFLETYFAMKNQSYDFVRIADRREITNKDYFWKSLLKNQYPQNLLRLLGNWSSELFFDGHPNVTGHEIIADWMIDNFEYLKNAL